MLRGLFGPSKRKLIDQMGSGDNTLALQAVKELRAKGWFKDGSLRGIHLRRANLQGAALAKADLESAVLQEANLTKAYLGETNLRVADLQGAILCEANMRNVILTQANLTGADLRRAYVPDADLSLVNLSDSNLRDANLWQAKLHGANLYKADMRGALLNGTRFDSGYRAARQYQVDSGYGYESFYQPGTCRVLFPEWGIETGLKDKLKCRSGVPCCALFFRRWLCWTKAAV